MAINKEWVMAGTVAGGVKAGITNKTRYGLNFYKQIGKAGGKISRGGGFTGDPEKARIAGIKGGQSSKRGPNKRPVSTITSPENVPSRFDKLKAWFR